MAEAETRPVLAVDVDGVISLFGFEGPLDQVGGKFHLIDGIAHCISDHASFQLARLGDVFELIWASSSSACRVSYPRFVSMGAPASAPPIGS